ncbi:hypothetical protein K469DRAFT_698115 [Zopfia rhizophila CBS 207.26]|uniref:Uncharacterized protein n=1 Tax=Zopfia rhizophila CBS 207.26 TaxID=1314779 RepID=A0A6A6DBC1_9PEZI|nr:hypothetical protein K469DRAFT_698115 [Zopfia rhizophila CBS 207.26]
MSPRRGSEETEKMGEEAIRVLPRLIWSSHPRKANAVKETLLKIGGCVESLKSEHEMLEDRNLFLQSEFPHYPAGRAVPGLAALADLRSVPCKGKRDIASQHDKSRIMVNATFIQEMNPDYPAPRVHKSKPGVIVFSFGSLRSGQNDSGIKYVDKDPDRMDRP